MIHQNFVLAVFHSPLQGRVAPHVPAGLLAGALREGEAAPNPHMPLPDRRLADALLKHAGVQIQENQTDKACMLTIHW